MLLKGTVHKSKIFLQKALENLRCFFFGEYQKLPKRHFSRYPFSCVRGNPKGQQADKFCSDLCDECESGVDKLQKRGTDKDILMEPREPLEQEEEISGSFMKFAKQEWVAREKKKTRSLHLRRKGQSSSKDMDGGNHVLAQKLKELEANEGGDLEQVQDIEEALHYYSRLRSPVYLDMVDKFFMDIYSEYSVPRAPESINNSRRINSIRQ